MNCFNPDGIYAFSSGVRFREEEFGGIVFYRPKLWSFEVNHAGLEILRTIHNNKDGKSVREIFPDFSEEISSVLCFMRQVGILKEVTEHEKTENG